MKQKLKQIGWFLAWAVALPMVQFMVLKSLHEEGRIGMVVQEKIETILKQEAGKMDQTAQQELTHSVLDLAKQYQMDPLLIMAIIHVESHFHPEAQSNKGALGLMQVRPIVLKEIAHQTGTSSQPSSQLLEKHSNLQAGVHYFSLLIKKFRGDVSKAILAYNQGPTNVARLYKNGPTPLSDYSKKVLSAYANYSNS